MSKRLLVGLLGANIGQSLAPALHEDAAAAAGMVGHYHLMDVDGPRPRTLPELLAAVRTAGFAGVNVTFPFKEAVIPLLDEVSPEAAEIGAVNTIVFDPTGRSAGHNTDRSGFRAAFLAAFGADAVRGKAVLQLGAGGAGRAVAFAL
ncbi:MAG TPA: shikimate dehydrogenase, partial [Reyranella sp.]|nr:shikimate dehydrogenase [Reyranella sp.]